MKNLILFVLGASVGALAANQILKGYYEKLAQEEIDSVREHFADRNREYCKLKDAEVTDILIAAGFEVDDKEDEFFEEEDTHVNYNDRYKERAEAYIPSSTKPDLTAIMKERGLPVADDEYDPGEETTLEVELDTGIIRVITEEDYFNDSSNNDKVELIYYKDDGVLTDNKDGIIPNAEELVGPKAFNNFGYASSSADIVYVRNDGIGIDFEIYAQADSYTEAVLGISIEPKTEAIRHPKLEKE